MQKLKNSSILNIEQKHGNPMQKLKNSSILNIEQKHGNSMQKLKISSILNKTYEFLWIGCYAVGLMIPKRIYIYNLDFGNLNFA
jgi:Tol biopolymer transport system component